MTRDEAIEKLKSTRDPGEKTSPAEMLVDGLVALGVLKLDEPRNAFEKFRSAMAVRQYLEASCVWRDIPMALEEAGLKIVEK